MFPYSVVADRDLCAEPQLSGVNNWRVVQAAIEHPPLVVTGLNLNPHPLALASLAILSAAAISRLWLRSDIRLR